MRREFNNQINDSLLQSLADFNNNGDLVELRAFYKKNFSDIQFWIKRATPRSSIEDVMNATKEIPGADAIFRNHKILFQQIHSGINSGMINDVDII